MGIQMMKYWTIWREQQTDKKMRAAALEENMELVEEKRIKEFVVHIPLPDEKKIEKMLVQQKKMELLIKYCSEDLKEEQVETKAMLNIQR